jgi:molybdate transport system regulatory protein
MSTKARQRPPAPPAIETPAAAAAAQAVHPAIRFRLDFHDGSVGIGKISLLEAIARTGSLSQAARDIGMSYRRAWLLIDNLNGEFDTPVISATVGGSGGGGARLTPFGQELIQAYRKLEARIVPLAAEHMAAVATHAVGPRRGVASGSSQQRGRLSRPLKHPA